METKILKERIYKIVDSIVDEKVLRRIWLLLLGMKGASV